MRKRHIYRFLEFFLIGFIMGIAEDLLAIHFATDATITIEVVYVAAIVALPFAVFSELIVDWKHIKFMRKLWLGAGQQQPQRAGRKKKTDKVEKKKEAIK
jgi:uncharacterized membrane protein (DUF106 family)